MRPKVAVIYNDPSPGRYGTIGEAKAVLGVLDEVEAVDRALKESRCPTVLVHLEPPLKRIRDILFSLDVDLVFNLFEGFEVSPNTEVEVARVLEDTRLPFTGCPSAALSLALDKVKAKMILRSAGINTPGCQVLTPETLTAFKLTYPCIIKPCGEDASHGITEDSLVYDYASLDRQVGRVSQFFGGRALVEEFVAGREFNATVLGNKEPMVLPISEIIYTLPPGMPKILTFAAKWEPDSLYYDCTNPVCPADIEGDLQQKMVDIAKAAFRLLGCSGYARVDFRLDDKGQPVVLEVNPNPDVSPSAGSARQAQAAGMPYAQFIQKIALLGLGR